jgi:hypothetical protein
MFLQGLENHKVSVEMKVTDLEEQADIFTKGKVQLQEETEVMSRIKRWKNVRLTAPLLQQGRMILIKAVVPETGNGGKGRGGSETIAG